MAAVRRNNMVIIAAICIGIGAIAYVDKTVLTVSLGFLYIFPLALSPIVMRMRWSMALVVLCVFLHDWFGPYERGLWQLTFRNSFSFIGYTSAVLIINRLVQQRRKLADTVRRQRDEMAREIVQAAQVQRQMLPRQAPAYDKLDVAARMVSSRVVAGDIYDFIELDEHHLGLVVADVAGKGVPAGLVMPTIKVAVRLESAYSRDCREIVTRLNHMIHEVAGEARYATLFYGIMDTRQPAIEYTNCGHVPGLLYRAAAGNIVTLDKGGLPLGLFDGVRYESEVHQLAVGDIIALYSDGIIEAENADEEQFSHRRLAEIMAANHSLNAVDLVKVIFDQVLQFSGKRPPADDQTLLILKIK